MALKVAVLVKEVPDLEVKIGVSGDGTTLEVEDRNVLNFFDELAVEEAVKLRESGAAEEVYCLSAGDRRGNEAVRRGLAMGADAAFLVDDPGLADADPLSIARCLAAVLKREGYDLVLAGRQSTDDEAGLIGPMVAELLGMPCVAGVVDLEMEDGSVRVAREQPEGRESLRVPLPVVLTAEKGLNTPRVPQVMGVMKAMKVEVPTLGLEELGVEAAPQLRPRAYRLPSGRPPVTMIDGEPEEAAAELVRRLREEAGVL